MEEKHAWIRGVKLGLPIALGYIPIAITYGLIAKSQGLPLWFILLLSLTTFAGSSQFIALQLLSAGAGGVEIVLTTFAINFRNFLMASAVSLRGPAAYTPVQKAFAGMTVTDEGFAVISGQPAPRLPFSFILGLQGILYLAWNGGTLLGAAVVGDLGTLWNNSLGIAIYAMFISMMIPIVRTNRVTALVALVTGVLSTALYGAGVPQALGNSSVLLISAVAGAALGAVILSREERCHG